MKTGCLLARIRIVHQIVQGTSSFEASDTVIKFTAPEWALIVESLAESIAKESGGAA